MVKKQKKNKVTKEQLAERKRRTTFAKLVDEVFIFSGFKSLKVSGFQFQLGNRSNELDHCYIYENVMVICEDTIKDLQKREKAKSAGKPYDDNHKLKKNETAGIIFNNQEEFFKILLEKFPENEQLQNYKYNEFIVHYLYFEYGARKIDADDVARYSNLRFIDAATLNYFSTMAKSIKASFKYELFRFLGVKRKDIGKPDPYGNRNIKPLASSIIYPDAVTGYNNGVRMVSFMMKPIDLIENCYVLRKDGWEQDVDLYQRLIKPNRIKEIREFVAKNKTTFLNNIIVTLPRGISFSKVEANGCVVDVKLDSINQYDHSIEIHIPVDFNSMAIIDGQHRVYAYYQDCDETNVNEQKIAKLRGQLNLLVTGIIYPDGGVYDDELERRKFESNLFVSINKNAKPVDADTLIQVQAIMNPTSGEAISRKTIELLNREEPFKNMFELSKVEPAPIKTASIIQYALSSLLVARNNENSLYHYWLLKNDESENFSLKNSEDIANYIKYCAQCLREYFKAIKSKFLSYWNKDSKLLMVISLNAFIIAFRETLKDTGGPHDYNYYMEVFKDWNFSFKNSKNEGNPFPYAGAQYSKFAKNEIIPLFLRYINSFKVS